MGSVVTDRLLDIVWLLGAVLYVLTFLSLGTVVLPQSLFGKTVEISRDLMIHAAQGLGFVLVAAVLLFLIFRVWRAWWMRCLHRLLDPVFDSVASRIERVHDTFSESIHALRRGRRLGAIVLTTVAYGRLGNSGSGC